MGKVYRQNEMWVVELAEEEWYGPKADKEALKTNFKDRAREQHCQQVVIFVIPDPLFPLYGDNKKHRVFQYQFPAAEKPFKVGALFTGEIDVDVYERADEATRRSLIRDVRDMLNDTANGVAGRYVIRTTDGKQLETGRV